MDDKADKEETPEASLDTWTMALPDAGNWLKMLDRMERRYAEGEKALADGKWAVALVALEEVAENDVHFRDVEHLLAQARDGDRLAHWYDEADAHGKAGQWDEACRVWAQVLYHRSDYGSDDALSGLLQALDGLLDQHSDLKEKLGQLESQGAGEEKTEEETEEDGPDAEANVQNAET